ncbi:hypothetical protein DPMN_178118 [Dreissena polymorpha]|uniref:Mitochondrial ribosomal protein S17 n=1 Tax=Dreissena polymorpha TaxID=45954 RepID=A0A9D4EEK0_DREPO|nr:hypothetical protein DPMN_178118 [Dreissena polymorpha]
MNRTGMAAMVRIGQVIKKSTRGDLNLVKVRAQNMKLDRRLMIYFPAKRDRWCVEQQNQTKIGDIVIMKNLPHAVDKDVFTKVNEVLYSVGNIKDPITGRLCRGTEFIDEEQRAQEVGRRQVEQMTQKRTIIE